MKARLRWMRRAAGARRTRLFALGVAVTLAFLILPSWNAFDAYRAADAISARQLQLARLIGRTRYLDELLTMSARMAAATGDPAWEQRYRRAEASLDAALEEMLELSAGHDPAAAKQTAAANRKLLALEDRAFSLVLEGRLAEASQLLSEDAYGASKRVYADGLEALATSIDARVQRDIAENLRRVVGAGALTIFSAGTLVLAWVGVVALIWRHLAARERASEEREYLESQIQYMQKLESLGVMAGGIAHDFNNLLVPILGNVELVLDELPADSPSRARLERLRDAGRRLSELTHQLLSYSGKGTFEARALDLSSLVRELTPLLAISVSKGAALDYDLEDGLPAVEGDSSQLSQVVMNLVTNASDALGGEAGRIAIRTRLVWAGREELSGPFAFDDCPEGAYVCLEVSDSGKGMDAATQRHVFDPFFTTRLTGRGLGLAVVLGIVRGHRGAIRVESEPERGTTFRIFLPRSDRAAEPVGVQPRAGVSWRGAGTLLVVDDEPDVRELADEMLSRLGFAVLTARDGREGIETFAQHSDRIEVVLLDLTMPGMSGGQVLAEIRRIRPDQPVVLMSGYNEEFVASEFVSRIAGFLQKPFSWEELGETLRSIVQRPQPEPPDVNASDTSALGSEARVPKAPPQRS